MSDDSMVTRSGGDTENYLAHRGHTSNIDPSTSPRALMTEAMIADAPAPPDGDQPASVPVILAAAGTTPVGGMTAVLIVDDQELVRTGFRVVLESELDLEVVGEAGDGAEAVELARRLRPDVVLMDVRMPLMDGIEATRRIRNDLDGDRRPRVLVLTTFDLDEHVYAALRAGASGFPLKDVRAAQLVDAVRTVAAGDALIAPAVTKRLVAEFAARPEPEPPPELADLTPREREVLELVGQGLSNGEIAQRLVVGEATVKTHVTRILTKLGLRDRVQAVVLAYESGVVRPGSR